MDGRIWIVAVPLFKGKLLKMCALNFLKKLEREEKQMHYNYEQGEGVGVKRTQEGKLFSEIALDAGNIVQTRPV